MHCHGEISWAPLVLDMPFFGTGLLVLAGVYLVADRLRQVEAVLDFLCLGVFEVLDPLHPAHVIPTGLLLILKNHRGCAKLDVGRRHRVALLQVCQRLGMMTGRAAAPCLDTRTSAMENMQDMRDE